jgi:hypothetical protein
MIKLIKNSLLKRAKYALLGTIVLFSASIKANPETYNPNTQNPEEIIQGLRSGALTGDTLLEAEMNIKKWSRKKKEALISKDWDSLKKASKKIFKK